MITDVQFTPNPLTASIDATIVDNNGNPAAVIEATKPWSVDIKLDVSAGGLFDGFCHFDLWADQVGGARKGLLGSTVVQVPGDGSFPGSLTVIANHPLLAPGNVSPGQPPHGTPDSGAYQLVLVMTHHNQPPGVGTATDTTAVVDFGIVRFS